MSANVGKIDRILRAILGVLLVIWPFASSSAMWASPVMTWGAVIVGAVLIATAGMKFCPMYRILGVNTCQR